MPPSGRSISNCSIDCYPSPATSNPAGDSQPQTHSPEPLLMDLFKMLGQFKDMQARMQTMQEEMAQRTFSALAGGGMVTADVDGKMQLKRIQIDPSILSDKEMVEDLIVVAVAEAQKKAAEAMQMELQKVTGGMNLPFQLPF